MVCKTSGINLNKSSRCLETLKIQKPEIFRGHKEGGGRGEEEAMQE
jgi:hypothetical protein